jgi:hypothetical protein
MIEDERKAPGEYVELSRQIISDLNASDSTLSDKKTEKIEQLIMALLDEHIIDERKHHDALVKLKEVVC